MDHDTFIDLVADRARVPSDAAVNLTGATLETLADRLTGGEALDLAAQLPPPLRNALRSEREHADRFGAEEFVDRVADRADVDMTTARSAVRAVFTTLREAITGGEFDDVMTQLPREYRGFVDPATVPDAARRR